MRRTERGVGASASGPIVIPNTRVRTAIDTILYEIARDRHADMVPVTPTVMMRKILLGVGGHFIAIARNVIDTRCGCRLDAGDRLVGMHKRAKPKAGDEQTAQDQGEKTLHAPHTSICQ